MNSRPVWLDQVPKSHKHWQNDEVKNDQTYDVAIIGCGITGATAAYYLRRYYPHLTVVVIEQAFPGYGASGRNGGHFQSLPENAMDGHYLGLLRERQRYHHHCDQIQCVYTPAYVKHVCALRQADSIVRLCRANRSMFADIIKREQIDCDFCDAGWMFVPATKKHDSLLVDEYKTLMADDPDVQLMTIKGTDRNVRFIKKDGSYHPIKYLYGLLDAIMAESTNISLLCHTRVQSIRENKNGVDLQIVKDQQAKTIVAKRVVIASNAFAPTLLPQLSSLFKLETSQVVYGHVLTRSSLPSCLPIVTSENGPFYMHLSPRLLDGAPPPSGPMVMGSRMHLSPRLLDVAPPPSDPMVMGSRMHQVPLRSFVIGGGREHQSNTPDSELVQHHLSKQTHDMLLSIVRHWYGHSAKQNAIDVAREWVGVFACTIDGMPLIGRITDRVIIGAGFNGYGGSYMTATGLVLAHLAAGRKDSPKWFDAHVFDPRRFKLA